MLKDYTILSDTRYDSKSKTTAPVRGRLIMSGIRYDFLDVVISESHLTEGQTWDFSHGYGLSDKVSFPLNDKGFTV